MRSAARTRAASIVTNCLFAIAILILVAGFSGGARVNAEDLPSFFSDAEREAMPESAAFDYKLVDKNGIRVPRQNGRGLLGVSASFSNADPRQLEYEAPILAQQGMNHLKMGMRPEGWGWADWLEHQAILQRLGISSVWSYYAMCCEDSYYARFLGLPEGQLTDVDLVTFEDGTKGYFRGMGTLGNIFSRRFSDVTNMVIKNATQRFKPFPTVIGYQYSNEVQLRHGSFDPEARASWQEFVKALFQDESPAADTSGDGVFFNKTFGTTYRSWSDVAQFGEADSKDYRRALLRDAWLGLSYARFVDGSSKTARQANPDLLNGAMICVPLSPTVDLSLVLSMPNVNAAYINTYFCWLGGGLLMEAIGHTYRKPVIASEINMPEGNYEQVRWGTLTHLPYLEGFEWFFYSWAPKGTPGEHGGKYGFVDKWTIDTTQPIPDERQLTEPCKAVTYNERFAIIPQMAPFVGRLNADFNRRILWISAGGYARDWLEDHEETGILRSELTSDVALALAPTPLDLSGYKVIIYRNLQSPCISSDIRTRLEDYVRSGGTVVTGAYFIGADDTWIGGDNKKDWWQGLRLARGERSGEGSTTIRFGKQTIEVSGTFEYLVSADPSVQEMGEIEDSTGAKYPFMLTKEDGLGQWVYINYPFMFQLTEPYQNYNEGQYAARMDCLRDAVYQLTGEVLPDRYATQWYSGPDCVLAIRQNKPGDSRPEAALPAGVTWPNGKFAVFETFGLKTEGDKPFMEVTNGILGGDYEVPPGEARLWSVKPYGEPIVLYADGTLKNGAKLESGSYSGGRLRFRFAERAFISSPVEPKSLVVDGKACAFSYDPSTQVVTVERTGQPADAIMTFVEAR